MSKFTLAFDPGGTTGFAALASDGRVLFTRAMTYGELEGFLEFVSEVDAHVVVEKGPSWSTHSQLTQRVEALILETFVDALSIQPSQWKGHPAAIWKGAYRYATRHEKDAISLARWFQATRSKDGEDERADDTARTDSSRTGH